MAEDFEVARGGTRLTMVLVCADPCLAHALAHAHAHVRDAGRHDTTVGMASDEWYYILGSSSNVTMKPRVLRQVCGCSRDLIS